MLQDLTASVVISAGRSTAITWASVSCLHMYTQQERKETLKDVLYSDFFVIVFIINDPMLVFIIMWSSQCFGIRLLGKVLCCRDVYLSSSDCKCFSCFASPGYLVSSFYFSVQKHCVKNVDLAHEYALCTHLRDWQNSSSPQSHWLTLEITLKSYLSTKFVADVQRGLVYFECCCSTASVFIRLIKWELPFFLVAPWSTSMQQFLLMAGKLGACFAPGCDVRVTVLSAQGVLWSNSRCYHRYCCIETCSTVFWIRSTSCCASIELLI